LRETLQPGGRGSARDRIRGRQGGPSL